MLRQMTSRPARHGLSVLLIGGLLIAGVATLSGCRDRLSNAEAVYLSDPARRHQIRLTTRPEALDLEISYAGESLNLRHRRALRVFLEDYRKGGVGRLIVQLPSSPRAHLGLQKALANLRSELDTAGYSMEDVEVHRARGRQSQFTIRLIFRRRVAIAPKCGRWPTDLGRNREALPYENFGCATQRNLAKIVRHARDLERPQDETPASVERRAKTWKDYKGQSSTAAPAAAPDAGKTPAPNK